MAGKPVKAAGKHRGEKMPMRRMEREMSHGKRHEMREERHEKGGSGRKGRPR